MGSNYDPNIHHRRSIRLTDYDYSQAGGYFVTICAEGKECAFGEIIEGEMHMSDAGRIVLAAWDELPTRFPGLELDAYIIMPNHIHGIIVLTGARPPDSTPEPRAAETDNVGAQSHCARQPEICHTPARDSRGAIHRARQPVVDHQPPRKQAPPALTSYRHAHTDCPPALGEIVRTFKAVTARRVRVLGIPGFAWQRNYYEHIIRDEHELQQIREYIAGNPGRWSEDENNPARVKNAPKPR
ncbi:MAG: transposase [Chloroflexi bacterium]|nr:transposase [Chloroflexota bacterium]